MTCKKIYNYITVSLIILVGLVFLGCNAGKMSSGTESGKGSAQLWQENCMRCHNTRSPSTYSDREWEVAMHHMRVRADLTAEEHRRILEYLQASN